MIGVGEGVLTLNQKNAPWLLLMASMGGMSSGKIPLTMILVAVFYLGGEISTAMAVRDSISRLTHVIGGVCGAALGFGLSE